MTTVTVKAKQSRLGNWWAVVDGKVLHQSDKASVYTYLKGYTKAAESLGVEVVWDTTVGSVA